MRDHIPEQPSTAVARTFGGGGNTASHRLMMDILQATALNKLAGKAMVAAVSHQYVPKGFCFNTVSAMLRNHVVNLFSLINHKAYLGGRETISKNAV